MGELGDAVLYGYPMPRAEEMGQRFLGYRRLCVVDYLCRPINTTRRSGAARAAPGVRESGADQVTIDRIEHLGPEIDALYAALAATETCLLVRDAAYLQWRYLDHPEQPYEIYTARRRGVLAGVMVLRPHHDSIANVCTIADWMVPDRHPSVIEALLSTATTRGRELDRWAVLAVFANNSEEHAILLARGFQVIPSATIMERRLTVWNGPAFPELADDFLIENWWYTIGDSDLV
jgi:hypothetical protein